jgi:uncharacterized protein
VSVFIDTSALYALLDRSDQNHTPAVTALPALAGQELITHSYVIVESVALTQRRLGADAVRSLTQTLVPGLSIVWIDEPSHAAGLAALLAALPTSVSLVDMVSFHVMREREIETAFAFDRDFASAGFLTIP